MRNVSAKKLTIPGKKVSLLFQFHQFTYYGPKLLIGIRVRGLQIQYLIVLHFEQEGQLQGGVYENTLHEREKDATVHSDELDDQHLNPPRQTQVGTVEGQCQAEVLFSRDYRASGYSKRETNDDKRSQDRGPREEQEQFVALIIALNDD